MRRVILVLALAAGLVTPVFAQQAEIDAVNAKWINFFNKGDFAGVASLYTEDATAFPPGSGMVKGRPGIATPQYFGLAFEPEPASGEGIDNILADATS